ncbi:MAG: 4-hydroxy-tetrahydrodipicolinate reductase [Oscillospiraceae bacterium]|jgi:4-hydroxy-tetrahydrodipicolinate reductase|nr:4-hydroxy-tetrahydrodipicolinate reductase [Oscillospiraceae bacterium]
MLNLLLSGCYGRLCAAVTDYIAGLDDVRVAAGLDPGQPQGMAALPFPVFASPDQIPDELALDAVLDCSHPSALSGLLSFALRRGLPCVIATTGYGEREDALLDGAKARLPLFCSRNMSLGVNLLKELTRRAARALGGCFDIEILEAHHNRKIDAPSGTALILAEAANQGLDEPRSFVYQRQERREARPKQEIGIHSIRGGTIVGEHSVIFAGFDEVITLSHSASSRRAFAAGCVSAVRFLRDKPPGLYGMDDLIGGICCADE